MKQNGVAKAWEQCVDYYEHKIYTPIPEDQCAQYFKEKYAPTKPTNLPQIQQIDLQKAEVPEISEEEVEQQIRSLKTHKAPGITGICAAHLKYLADEHKSFIKLLTDAFNILLKNPDRIQELDKAYEFQAIFIPKKDGGVRPIAINCMIINVFHRLLVSRLRS